MHIDLISFYERIFAFKTYHNWLIDEVYDLLPWEVEVMTSLIANYIDAKEAQRKQDVATRNSM